MTSKARIIKPTLLKLLRDEEKLHSFERVRPDLVSYFIELMRYRMSKSGETYEKRGLAGSVISEIIEDLEAAKPLTVKPKTERKKLNRLQPKTKEEGGTDG